ncbi:MAG: hypothetical protein R8K20_08380, partial [Gallionellaceae bacterium]
DTSGLPEMDFHITNHHAESEGGTRYTEKLLYMPNSFLCFGMRPGCEHSEGQVYILAWRGYHCSVAQAFIATSSFQRLAR